MLLGMVKCEQSKNRSATCLEMLFTPPSVARKHTTIRGFYVDDSFIIHGRHIKKQSDRHDRRVVMLIWLCVCVFYLHIELMSSRCVLEKSLRVPEIKFGFRFWASSSATICFHVPRHSSAATTNN